jgi:starch phosphorylase
MARLTPLFSANRAVREYTDQYYIPAAAAYRERAANKGAIGVEMVNWLRALEQNWGNLRLGEMSATTIGEYHVFEVQVYLNGLETNAVNVELYAEGVNGGNPVRQEMMRGGQLVGAENGYTYGTKVLATRPDTDYTVRIIPHRPGVAIPLEASRILWQ